MKIGIVKFKANICLFLAAIIWGATFVVQKTAMENLPPMIFIASRCFMGAISLFVISLFFKKNKKQNDNKIAETGIIAGIFLYMGMSLQQTGMVYSSAGHAGFISSLYILIVPLITLLFGQKIKRNVWYSIIIALFGLYLLSVADNFKIAHGDLIILFSALFFAFHIIWISKRAKKSNAIKLSCYQFLSAGTLSLISSLIFETTTIENFKGAWFEILFAGILSCAIAYTLQIKGQKHIKPQIASLILSLESVFSVFAGYIFLHEILSSKEIFGCLLMFTAIYLAEKKQ